VPFGTDHVFDTLAINARTGENVVCPLFAPEDSPSPSWEDTSKMTEIFERSEHVLAGMLLVIVGRKTTPDGIWCGFVGKFGVQRLGPDLD